MYELYKDKDNQDCRHRITWIRYVFRISYQTWARCCSLPQTWKTPLQNRTGKAYAKEYGMDTIEFDEDAINENDVVLLHDDLGAMCEP